MVFTTIVQLVKRNIQLNPNVDKAWRKRQILKLSGHFYARPRNCFSMAIRKVHRALQDVTVGRQLKKELYRGIWEKRMEASCRETNYLPEGSHVLLESLVRANIQLNRQSLANLATWEPRTFKSIIKIGAVKAKQERIGGERGIPPENVFTRGKL